MTHQESIKCGETAENCIRLGSILIRGSDQFISGLAYTVHQTRHILSSQDHMYDMKGERGFARGVIQKVSPLNRDPDDGYRQITIDLAVIIDDPSSGDGLLTHPRGILPLYPPHGRGHGDLRISRPLGLARELIAHSLKLVPVEARHPSSSSPDYLWSGRGKVVIQTYSCGSLTAGVLC